ncbi:MAG TPA: DUF1192 domain-containing protein [Alphaproteobacteria bacterium]|nr:DUF1192 domain-containing protein [Alphaproteobacteria bacterium]
MDTDDLEPRKRPVVQKNLDGMSVAELEEYIAGLEAEIARARDAIARKQSHRFAAESFFKS